MDKDTYSTAIPAIHSKQDNESGLVLLKELELETIKCKESLEFEKFPTKFPLFLLIMNH